MAGFLLKIVIITLNWNFPRAMTEGFSKVFCSTLWQTLKASFKCMLQWKMQSGYKA